MKPTILFAAALLLAAPALTASAQAQSTQTQSTHPSGDAMDSMDGMDMGDMPMAPQPQQAPQKTRVPSAGMPKDMRVPKDMTAPVPGDRSAQQATQSMRASEQEQTQQLGVKPTPGSDVDSVSADTFALQEREAPGIHTGGAEPAPDLLNAVAGRAPMSLAAFLAMAHAQNPTLAQTADAVQRARQQARQAGLPPDPSFGYSSEDVRGGSYHGGSNGAFVQQTFVLGGKLGLRRDVYAAQAKASQITVSEQQYRVDATVSQAFYAALAAQAEVVVRERMLRVALDAAETAHQLSNVGQAGAPDVLESEVEAEQAQVAFVTAQRTFLSSFSTLAADAGALDLAPAPLLGDIESPPALDTTQQIAQILAASPQVAHAQQAVAVADAKLKAARRESVPDLNVNAGVWYDGETLDGTNKEAGPVGFATAGIDLPLWNRNQGNVGAAKAEVEQAQAEVIRTRLMLKREADMLAQNYAVARFTTERYRTELLPRARRAYQLYVMKYQQMAQSYPQVLLAQRTLFDLQSGYLDALQQEWSAALALQNFTLSGGLMMPENEGADTTEINRPDAGE